MSHTFSMKSFPLLAFLSVLLACEQGYRTEVYEFYDGSTKTFKIRKVLDNDSLLIAEHKNGQIYLKAIRKYLFDSKCEEGFYYDEDGQLMDYKYYIDDGLKFYARYDSNEQVVQMNGDPILWYNDPDFPTPIEQNSPRVFETITFTPPFMVLKSWMNSNEDESPMQQIKNSPDSLDMTVIKNDTLGYIFMVPDTTTIDVTVLWSLEDERTGELLKAGKFSQKYKGIATDEQQ